MIALFLAAIVSGAELVSGSFSGHEVEVEGRVIGLTESGFALKVGEVPVTVIAEPTAAYFWACSVTQPKLRVKGVLEQVYGITASGEREDVIGLRLRPENDDDIVFELDIRFILNPFTLGLILTIVLAYIFLLSRRQVKTRTLMGERKRMAGDLHDTIEQHLVGAGMLMQLGKYDAARDVLVRAKKEMREIVWGLMNDELTRLSPSDMIRAFAKDQTKSGVCRVETRLVGLPERMSAAEMRDLSLIIREAVGNAVKHGNATKIAIVVDPIDEGGWHLRISNNGVPINLDTAPGSAQGHFGLEGMKERARRLGAEFSIAAVANRTIVSLSHS